MNARELLVLGGASMMVLLFNGCRSRTFAPTAHSLEESDSLPSFRVPSDRDTWLFTWTFDESAKADPGRFLTESLKGVAERNRGFSGQVWGARLGYGVYFAGDPVHSKEWGNTLVVVKAAREGVVGFEPTTQTSVPLVRSSFPGLFYLWGVGRPIVGDFALVVRDATLLQLGTAKAFGGETPVPFAKKVRFTSTEGTSWQEILDQFADVMSFFGLLGAVERSEGTNEARFHPPLVDAEGNLNRWGILSSIAAEFHDGHEGPMRAFDSLLHERRLSYCALALANAGEEDRRSRKPCIWRLFEELSDAYTRGVEPAAGNMGINEARLILKTAGYLDPNVVPVNFKELGAALEAEFRRTGAADRAQEAVDAYKILKREFGSWSLQNWAPSR